MHIGAHTHTDSYARTHTTDAHKRSTIHRVVTKIECSVRNMRIMKGKNFNLRMNIYVVSMKENNGKKN